MKDARNEFWVHFFAESDSCNLQTEVLEKEGNWSMLGSGLRFVVANRARGSTRFKICMDWRMRICFQRSVSLTF
jgi:hypothetical protein